MIFAAEKEVAVLCSVIQCFGCLEDQLVQPSGDIARAIGLVVTWPAANRRIVDSFEEPSAMDESEPFESEQSRCSAAWLALVAALELGRIERAEKPTDLVDKCETIAGTIVKVGMLAAAALTVESTALLGMVVAGVLV